MRTSQTEIGHIQNSHRNSNIYAESTKVRTYTRIRSVICRNNMFCSPCGLPSFFFFFDHLSHAHIHILVLSVVIVPSHSKYSHRTSSPPHCKLYFRTALNFSHCVSVISAKHEARALLPKHTPNRSTRSATDATHHISNNRIQQQKNTSIIHTRHTIALKSVWLLLACHSPPLQTAIPPFVLLLIPPSSFTHLPHIRAHNTATCIRTTILIPAILTASILPHRGAVHTSLTPFILFVCHVAVPFRAICDCFRCVSIFVARLLSFFFAAAVHYPTFSTAFFGFA